MIVGVDVTSVRTSTEGPEFKVGTVFRNPSDGKRYKYLKFDNGAGNVASVAGNAAYYYGASGAADADTYSEVTMDLTDAVATAGAFCAVIADGGFGWIQTGGYCTMTTAFTDGADGNVLTHVGAGADGTLDVSAAATSQAAAVCIDATAKLVYLTCPE
jgi:hypothetical protein